MREARQLDVRDDALAMLGALDALRVAITIFDAHGRLAYANSHFNYLFASLPPHGQLIGKSYEDLIRLEIQGGEIGAGALAQGADAFIAQRLAQLESGNFAPLDVPLADRRVIEIKARAARGGMTVLLWSDVTAARAQLARLQEAVTLSAEAFAFFDSNDRLAMANELYARICGVASLDDILGLPFPQIAAEGVQRGRILVEETPEQWLERRLKGHRSQAGAVTIRTNSGEAYLVRDRAAADGGRVMIFTDITDKVRAETALAEQQTALADSRAQAEKQSGYLADLTHRLGEVSAGAESAKTTLLRTMGHELKTPLNAILGFSDLMATLADNLGPEQVREYAGLIHQGGANLLKMINQIMDLTKISAGRYELRRAPLDAGGLLWLVRDVFQAKAEARGITIDADGAPIGLMVDADEAVLTAMLHNLVDNAVTFTHELAVVRLQAVPCEGGVALSVSDNGGGVAHHDLARILEPFEHAAGGGEAAEHSKGAGLGLTLVKAFAELHGGRLELKSAPGQGFTATIVLPGTAMANAH